MTERFDPGDRKHQAIKQGLMQGIALKDIATTGEVSRDLERVGFQVVEAKDRSIGENGTVTPWYKPMESRSGTLWSTLRRSPLGRKSLMGTFRLAEMLGLFPRGSSDVVALLDRTAISYVEGGRSGIFTPLYCFLARKPL